MEEELPALLQQVSKNSSPQDLRYIGTDANAVANVTLDMEWKSMQ